MEKYAVPVAQVGESPKPIIRSQWKRSLIELTGKSECNYRHDLSPLLMQSYSEIGAFPHAYRIMGVPCKTHITSFYPVPLVNVITDGYSSNIFSPRQMGVSALEFDTKGIYLASVTRSGCLTVHEFESLYCKSNESVLYPEEDEEKHLLHISFSNSIDAVRWNPANQDEIACTSLSNNEVHIFDIGYISSEPTEVLRKRPNVTVHGGSVRKGLSDIAFFNDNSRVLASDTCGAISIWDRRASDLPQTGLTTDANSSLTSIQLSGDQCVYGASKSGFIYIWDLRAGRSSAAFQSHNEVHYSPITSVKIASMLNKIRLLKAQSNILPKEIQSIDINPSCPYQLGFHLDDGWSGVLDMHSFQVTHIHCPPPPWLEETNAEAPVLSSRKPSWLAEHSTAKKMEMTGDGYLWISTNGITDLFHSINSTMISSLKGMVGVKSYFPENRPDFLDVRKRFRQKFRSDYPEEEQDEPGIFAVQGYNAVKLLDWTPIPVTTVEIVSVIGKGYHSVYWTEGLGFSETADDDINGANTCTHYMDNVGQALWPESCQKGTHKAWFKSKCFKSKKEIRIYAVGSSSSNGIHLLDFYPHTSSPCHVNHDDSNSPQDAFQRKQNRLVPLSERVTACTTHPLNGTIVAGTVEASLLMVSQKHLCKTGDDADADADAAEHV